MAYLFDTDAISELLRPRPLPGYVEWLSSIPREDQYASAVTIGELYQGAFRSRARERHLTNIEERVLPAIHGSFETGPATPPFGTGSFQHEHLGVSGAFGNDKVTTVTYAYADTRLADITHLSYHTYRSSSSTNFAQQLPSIELQVYRTGTSGFHTLVFEPVYNTAQGSVTPDVWQSWDAIAGGSGRWWATGTGTGLPFNFTWDELLAAWPDAVVIGHVGVNTGSGWNGYFVGSFDGLTVGVDGFPVTYDFEVSVTKDICKDGGWRSSTDPVFRNQGECVS